MLKKYLVMSGMLVKYGLSTEGGFGGGEKLNPVGVLVSCIGLLSLLVPVL